MELNGTHEKFMRVLWVSKFLENELQANDTENGGMGKCEISAKVFFFLKKKRRRKKICARELQLKCMISNSTSAI